MKNIFLVLTTICLGSCVTLKSKYFTYYGDQQFEMDRKQGYVDSILLDKSYTLYVREICRKKPAQGFYVTARPDRTSAVIKCDCQDPAVGYEKERQEIQYLFLSRSLGKAVFISTMPAAIINGQMTYDMPMFDNDSFVNVNYFNTFFFGVFEEGKISFMTEEPSLVRTDNKGANYHWFIQENTVSDFVEISQTRMEGKKNPQIFMPSDIVQPAIRFYKKSAYTMGLSNQVDQKVISKDNTSWLAAKKIYLTTSEKNGQGNVENISFVFDENLAPGTVGSKTIFFPSFRLHAAPVLNSAKN